MEFKIILKAPNIILSLKSLAFEANMAQCCRLDIRFWSYMEGKNSHSRKIAGSISRKHVKCQYFMHNDKI